jgi:hypothetical protein
MNSELPAFGFSFMGLVFTILTVSALWRGEIRERSDAVINRRMDADPD